MARQEGSTTAAVYEAARQWADRGLRKDDSLFTTGSVVWSKAVVDDLHARFVERPDESSRDFVEKFRDQLSGAPPATIQLAAEVLYVHLLVLRSVSGAKKRELVETVLSWSSSPATIPPDLATALDQGLVAGGTGFNTYRPFLVSIVIKFARLWKGLGPEERDAALGDPWEFRRLVFSVEGPAKLLQQHALVHLVFPDTFEDIVSDDHKHEVARAYAKYVGDLSANVDRKLLDIREALVRETGAPPRYYDPGGPLWPGASPRCWKIAPGDDAWQWDECRRDGFIAIGWNNFGDLTSVDRAAFELVRDRLIREKGWTKNALEQVWRFRQIREGDRIVANRGTAQVLGIGTVVGPYQFVPDAKHGHQLPVRWDDTRVRSIAEEGWRRTLIPLPQEKFDRIVAIEPEELPQPRPDNKENADAKRDFQIKPVYDLARCAADLHMDEAAVSRWVRAIERKRQAILYGPPGTGKTYAATRLARHLVGGTDGFTTLVQFHPSYTYEDFVEGIRPRAGAGGRLEYPQVPGRFLDFCREASPRSGRCVLIIDEINRANLSRVFGELMYLLEYRGESVELAGGTEFRIPLNVRVIGTMNTADRSIALVDHALRRRFAFLPLYPDYDVLLRYHGAVNQPLAEALVAVLRELNREINDRHYEIGMSFFLIADLAAHLEDVWRMEIEPYVEEFFFDQPERAAAARWEVVRQRLER